MNDFLYISDSYRNAVYDYVLDNEELSEEEKLTFEMVFFEEQQFVKDIGRPPQWYVNDLFGEEKFIFNMKNDFFPNIEFEYYEGLSSLHDIIMNRAEEIKNMYKVIDVFYSGGLDSSVVLTALMEVCPKDQLRIVMGTTFPLKLWPKMAHRLQDYCFEIVEPVISPILETSGII